MENPASHFFMDPNKRATYTYVCGRNRTRFLAGGVAKISTLLVRITWYRRKTPTTAKKTSHIKSKLVCPQKRERISKRVIYVANACLTSCHVFHEQISYQVPPKAFVPTIVHFRSLTVLGDRETSLYRYNSMESSGTGGHICSLEFRNPS